MDFAIAVERVRQSTIKTSDQVKLELYALYKQATIGPCNTSPPWAIQFVERAKWDAWKALGPMDKLTAQKKYCEICDINKL